MENAKLRNVGGEVRRPDTKSPRFDHGYLQVTGDERFGLCRFHHTH